MQKRIEVLSLMFVYGLAARPGLWELRRSGHLVTKLCSADDAVSDAVWTGAFAVWNVVTTFSDNNVSADSGWRSADGRSLVASNPASAEPM